MKDFVLLLQFVWIWVFSTGGCFVFMLVALCGCSNICNAVFWLDDWFTLAPDLFHAKNNWCNLVFISLSRFNLCLCSFGYVLFLKLRNDTLNSTTQWETPHNYSNVWLFLSIIYGKSFILTHTWSKMMHGTRQISSLISALFFLFICDGSFAVDDAKKFYL